MAEETELDGPHQAHHAGDFGECTVERSTVESRAEAAAGQQFRLQDYAAPRELT